MHLLKFAAILAAIPAAANAQDSAWQFYEGDDGSKQIFVQAEDGSQLIMKCDKPGKQSVSAVVYTPEPLMVTGLKAFDNRPIDLSFADGRWQEEIWRFYKNAAIAVNLSGERSLPSFVRQLADTTTLKVRLHPDHEQPSIDKEFAVSGARDAIGRIYKSCKDKSPLD